MQSHSRAVVGSAVAMFVLTGIANKLQQAQLRIFFSVVLPGSFSCSSSFPLPGFLFAILFSSSFSFSFLA